MSHQSLGNQTTGVEIFNLIWRLWFCCIAAPCQPLWLKPPTPICEFRQGLKAASCPHTLEPSEWEFTDQPLHNSSDALQGIIAVSPVWLFPLQSWVPDLLPFSLSIISPLFPALSSTDICMKLCCPQCISPFYLIQETSSMGPGSVPFSWQHFSCQSISLIWSVVLTLFRVGL